MNLLWQSQRMLTRPVLLWTLFGSVFCLSLFSLWGLSRHVIELDQQQRMLISKSEQENVARIALYRIDSFLGPFLTSLAQSPTSSLRDEARNPNASLIQETFYIEPDSSKSTSSPKTLRFRPVDITPRNEKKHDSTVTNSHGFSMESWANRLSPEQIMDVVRARTVEPANDEKSQSLVQAYGSFDKQFDPAIKVSRNDLTNRNRAIQQQVASVLPYDAASMKAIAAIEAPSKIHTFWIDDALMVARPNPLPFVEMSCAVLDWERLQNALRDELANLIPNARFEPLDDQASVDLQYASVALPIRLVVPPLPPSSMRWSATHSALFIAWATLAGALLISVLAISRLISLSERRATFVGAVTHEMRTPLTTFRLYSDLLARNMVSDEAERRSYLETLRIEADRLAHLVDNVLRYSRLQRVHSPPVRESLVLSQYIDRIRPRLAHRLEIVGMQLDVTVEEDGLWLTDAAAMEQVLFNLIDNAAKYALNLNDPRVHLIAKRSARELTIRIVDHGPGIDVNLNRRLFKPFSRLGRTNSGTATGVGLGLALSSQIVRSLGGRLSHTSPPTGGSEFMMRFSFKNRFRRKPQAT